VEVINISDKLNEDDLREIFGEIEEQIKVFRVNMNDDEQPIGTALLSFETASQAAKCVSEYDGCKVDGRPMYCRILSAEENPCRFKVEKPSRPSVVRSAASTVERPPPERTYRAPREARAEGESKAEIFGSALGGLQRQDRPRRGGRGGGGTRSGGRGGRWTKEHKTQAELDSEMDDWNKSRMES